MDLRKGSLCKPGQRICYRCQGRRELYKVGAGWTLSDMGGPLKKCPLCAGEGCIDTLEAAAEKEKIAIEVVKKTRRKREKKVTEEETKRVIDTIESDLNQSHFKKREEFVVKEGLKDDEKRKTVEAC